MIQQANVACDDHRYGLYLADAAHPNGGRKILEANYIADLSSHPNSPRWTALVDQGKGVGLYDIDLSGQLRKLVAQDDGEKPEAAVPGRPFSLGLQSYAWAPDGRRLWYSRAIESPPIKGGVMYNSQTMAGIDVATYPAGFNSRELHYFESEAGVK